MSNDSIRPAATLVLLRDADNGLETLLLRRLSKNGKGSWVFPGGVVEEQDRLGEGDGDCDEAAARVAAARETHEEAGIRVSVDQLQLISHWTTPDAPEIATKRFATWFFLSGETVGEINVDNVEIDAFRWDCPSVLIEEHRAGALKLLPPTLVTLTEIAACHSFEQVQAFYAERDVPYIEPRMSQAEDKICMLYGGDAGYESCDGEATGARNRSWLEGRYWRYEFSTS